MHNAACEEEFYEDNAPTLSSFLAECFESTQQWTAGLAGTFTTERQMTYETNPRNVLPNGLTLLQVNPDCAARLDPQARDHGWLYIKGADGQWVTHRKLSDAEIEEAYDQAADMAVKHGTKVRAG